MTDPSHCFALIVLWESAAVAQQLILSVALSLSSHVYMMSRSRAAGRLRCWIYKAAHCIVTMLSNSHRYFERFIGSCKTGSITGVKHHETSLKSQHRGLNVAAGSQAL